MTAEHAKLVNWFAFLDVITDSKDYLHDFQLGKKSVVSPAMLFIKQSMELIETIKDQTTDKSELAQIDELSKELRKYRQAVYIYTEEVSSGYKNGATAREMEDYSSKAAKDIVQMSLNVTEMIGRSLKNRSSDVIEINQASQRILYGVLGLSVLCTFVTSIAMGKALARPIRKLAIAAKNISDGDLLSRVQIDSHDEIGLLAAAFNNMAEKVNTRSQELTNSNELLQQEISVRKQAEKTLLKARKDAEAANEAKSQFLANMSHEIRTPMNSIIGFSDLLADESLTDEQKMYIDTIKNSSCNLLAIINDILDFSKIEAGQLDTEYIEFSLDKLLNSIESLMSHKASEKGLDFKIIKKADIPGEIRSDPTRLQQCLVNLIGNAIKFTDEGHVYVYVSSQEKDSQTNICFAVKDTGIGIPKEKHAVIFNSFSQADESHTRKFGGTGLGLSITKQLIELLGGEVSLVSDNGKETTFTLTIPVSLEAAEQPVPERNIIEDNFKADEVESNETEFSGNVLVAEDNQTNQMLIKILLKQLGLEVSIAEDGNEALQQILEGNFDLILMDMEMPLINGYETIKKLREKEIKTPVIALTDNTTNNNDIKCKEAGCDEYLSKPIEQTRLRELIAKFLPAKEAAFAGTEGF